eukprot:6635571-Lingulodinium_polyedra.AAC.1
MSPRQAPGQLFDQRRLERRPRPPQHPILRLFEGRLPLVRVRPALSLSRHFWRPASIILHSAAVGCGAPVAAQAPR